MVDETPTFIEEYNTSTEICDHIRFYFYSRQDSTFPGRVSGSGEGDSVIKTEVKDSTDLCIVSDQFFIIKDYVEHIIESVNNYVDKYCTALGYNVGSYGIEVCNIQHYKPNGGFKHWHCERVHKVISHRFLTFMTYLTDTPGGGTEFLYQNKKYDCVKGRTLIWPTDFTHTHRGEISKDNEKMIITGWIVFMDHKSA